MRIFAKWPVSSMKITRRTKKVREEIVKKLVEAVQGLAGDKVNVIPEQATKNNRKVVTSLLMKKDGDPVGAVIYIDDYVD